jgi:hemerythrin superfamily protein
MEKTQDAIALLKADHRLVKGLFDEFKKSEDKRQKAKLVAQAITELKIHATIEEEIFYPTVRKALKKAIGKEETTDMMDEADEEHHVAKLLIAELETMKASDDHWEAKFTVLSENILHHVKEEESEMFSEARKLDLDYDALGAEMLARKTELKASGVPTFAEQTLIAEHGIADSPAEASKAYA